MITIRVKENQISIHALREEGDDKRHEQYHHLWKFLSTPSARRATKALTRRGSCRWKFLSTPSARRATRRCRPSRRRKRISIHALREEGDDRKWRNLMGVKIFLSTPSARRATLISSKNARISSGFLSTPSARRATRCFSQRSRIVFHFYPRPPRGGRRQICPIQPSISASICI